MLHFFIFLSESQSSILIILKQLTEKNRKIIYNICIYT